LTTDRSVYEALLGSIYGANFLSLTEGDRGLKPSSQWIGHGSIAYVTGSHAFKTGFTAMHAYQIFNADPTYPEQYIFANQKPVGITQALAPQTLETDMKLQLGLFAQDQWTIRRLTLNLGVRYDSINAYS